jgi:RHS repeat-associated protein
MDGETGLVYMQQRYYDPQIGRFLSVDPVGVSSAMGTNFNRYWYANNNSFRFVDPEGLQACPIGQEPCTGNEQPPKRENRASAQSRWNRANLHRQTFSDVPSGGWTSATFMAATAVNAAGLSTTARELSFVRNGHWYSTIQDRWYSVSAFHGNQYTELQRDVLARADRLRATGQGLFVIAAGLSIYQGVSNLSNGDYFGAAHAGVDIAWGAASTYGGPIGLAGAAGYFGTSMLIQVPMVRDITVSPLTDTFCSTSGDC